MVKCRHKYLFQHIKKEPEYDTDYACMKCGLNWRFDCRGHIQLIRLTHTKPSNYISYQT